MPFFVCKVKHFQVENHVEICVGTKTEGIFRIPAGGAELNTVKDRLDHGNYDVITGCTQVYTPCALIKLWLRELPEGLVPSSF